MRVRSLQKRGSAKQTYAPRRWKLSVVLTADHGAVRADTPAEVFCQEEQSAHPRVKIGPNISCDERQALFVEAPERYGLPAESAETAYAIAKGRFYFVYP